MTVIIAPVKNGKLMMNDAQRRSLGHSVAQLEGQDARITITRDVRVRTMKQNRYYWGVVIDMLAGHTGHTPEEIHEAMKTKFLGRRHMTLGDQEVEISKSTTDINTAEMTAYIEQIRAFAAQFLQLNIPSPEEANRVLDTRKRTADGRPIDSKTGEVLDTE